MNTHEVVVIDYGVGNLLSVSRGLEHCGAKVEVTADPKTILSAARVILPGVGAFANAMTEFRRLGLDDAVLEVVSRGIPFLGICIGMQMLLDESEEFGVTPGLGLIPGRVVPVPSSSANEHTLKIPHIGWNSLLLSDDQESWEGTVLREIKVGEEVYFVHSFMAVPNNPAHRIAECNYGGIPVSATIGRDNIVGCQFHPEKSGEIGLKVLRGFLSL
jgi:imidazole glycerol-phosphate synthase subunit HisH